MCQHCNITPPYAKTYFDRMLMMLQIFQTFLVDGLLQPCSEGNSKQLDNRQSRTRTRSTGNTLKQTQGWKSRTPTRLTPRTTKQLEPVGQWTTIRTMHSPLFAKILLIMCVSVNTIDFRSKKTQQQINDIKIPIIAAVNVLIVLVLAVVVLLVCRA